MSYIDKHKLMQRIETEALRWGEEYDLTQIMSDIEDFPEADVERVVRCQDCIYFKSGECHNDDFPFNCEHRPKMYEDDFCSYGK